MAYSAASIANAFLLRGFRSKLPISPMMIQKLLYLAQGYHLYVTDKPLIDEPVSGRAFYINLGLIKFGTREPIQGASFFLALALLMMLFGTVMLEFFWGLEKTKELLNWITTPWMLTIGVAIGRSGNSSS